MILVRRVFFSLTFFGALSALSGGKNVTNVAIGMITPEWAACRQPGDRHQCASIPL